MTRAQFRQILNYIIVNGIKLKNQYITEADLKLDYICIFSQNKKEYQQLLKHASTIGKKIKQTKTGPVFKLQTTIKTPAGSPKILKIRLPDPTRTQRGDLDFITTYPAFKLKYLNQNCFKLIKRKNFDMIELRDNQFNVLIYFSSQPPSQIFT